MTALLVLLLPLMTFVSQSVLVTCIHDSPAVFAPTKNYNGQSNSQIISVPYVPERSLEFNSTEKSRQMKTSTTETSSERITEPSKTTPFDESRLLSLGYEFEIVNNSIYSTSRYYKLHLRGRTWRGANETCSSEGAHLAIINSEEERDILKKMVDNAPEPYDRYGVYIGINDFKEEGKFETIFGEPIEATGFNEWHEGEPNNDEGSEDCGVLLADKLNDISCIYILRFICEKEFALTL